MRVGSFLVSEYQILNDSVAGSDGLFFIPEVRKCREDESPDLAYDVYQVDEFHTRHPLPSRKKPTPRPAISNISHAHKTFNKKIFFRVV